MTVIKVPKTPAKAFNPHRRPSALLLSQIAHLEWAALPAAQRKPGQLPTRRVKTEGQAAARIAQLTALVLQTPRSTAEPSPAAPVSRAPVRLPPIPPVAAKRPAAGRQPAGSSAHGRTAASTSGRKTTRKPSRAGRKRSGR